ncbi:FxSxx-COOH system tetratricopeptide repeat protein [Streptacidiphilus cavernicola]|uniref:FxSxx-COOH system tetratricopeptide repeat protein n=1 Tax=Streptacidiphilus cavernicola TaxID=3342716 RepID=A0ABV6VNK3_9ACTN
MNDTAQEPDAPRDGRVVTFYSYKGGTGRTMTLANTAWILAANGKRVLAVDWDLEAPGLHRFFHPFIERDALATSGGVVDMVNNYLERAYDMPAAEQAVESGHAAVATHAIGLSWDFPGGGGIDFVSAGRQNEDYSTILNGLNWDQFYQDYEGGTFLDALGEQMRRDYDYTLIDSRTGLSDSSKICTQHLPDDLVVCFTLSDQSIDGAAGVARHVDLRFNDGNIRILPVPMRVDEGEKERADRGRAVARQRFRGLPREVRTVSSAEYWGAVEIPYRPFYAYEEVLATFGDVPGVPSSVLGACERLVGELTRGEVTALPPMPEELRLGTLARFTRKPVAGHTEFRLRHAIEDQMWADWVSFVLERAGYPVTAARLDDESAPAPVPAAQVNGEQPRELVSMPLLTRHFARTPRAEEFWGPLTPGEPAVPGQRTVGLRLGAVQPGAPAGHSAPLDLSSPSLNGPRSAELLLRHVGADEESVRLAAEALGEPQAPRYPGLRALVVNLQSRNSDFTGRAAELGRLRDRLTGRGPDAEGRAQALFGLGGVGKSQLALEYAYRYLPDYDVVWWIAAERPASITTDLAELAQALDLRGSQSDPDAAAAARNALSQGTPFARWLLVFDNAEDPDSLREFLPGGDGHVIITSRNQVWNRDATELEVDVFTPDESVAHLRRRVPGLDPAQARRLAEALGDLPLAVEHAAAYLLATGMSADTYLDLLDTYPSDMFGAAPGADYPLPIVTTFAASLEKLAAEWPSAKRLLQMSVFLGPDAFSQALVYKSPAMVGALSAADPRLRSNPVQALGRVVQAIRRLSLGRVDGRKNTIQVHRLLQSLLLLQMTEAEREQIRDEVRQVLVASARWAARWRRRRTSRPSS